MLRFITVGPKAATGAVAACRMYAMRIQRPPTQPYHTGRLNSASGSATTITRTTACALMFAQRFASSQRQRNAHVSPAAHTVDHYRRLGVEYDATVAEIKAAYRARALECHPDVVEPHKRAEAEVLFRNCSEAFETLSDPTRRRTHDAQIGVEEVRRRRQQARQRRAQKEKAGAATASSSASPSSSSGAASKHGTSSFSSAFARDAAQMETEEERAYYHQRRRGAGARDATDGASASSGSSPDGEDWGTVDGTPQGRGTQSRGTGRRPFVRGDADRVFREAFEGKSLDQILFAAQRRRRHDATARAASQTVAATRGEGSTPNDVPAGRDEVLRRVMERASEAYAHNVARQYGPGVLKHVRARQLPQQEGPATPPPSSHMPFRPFVNVVVPESISTPMEPRLGPLGSATDGSVEPDDITLSAVHDKVAAAELERLERSLAEATAQGQDLISADLKKQLAARRKALGLHQYELADGTLLSPFASLDRARKEIQGGAHNMGQMYSYHRPY